MSVARDTAQQRMQRLEAVVEVIERRGGEAAEAAREILTAVLDVHEAAIARALEIAAERGPAGADAVRAMANDPLISSVLLLHDKHPEALEARARAAVGRLAVELERRGARVELTSVGDGVVRVSVTRLDGGSVRAFVEEALLAAAPDAEAIEVSEPDPTLLPASSLLRERGAD